jgi:NAD(P)-dependent dehydrogenase (short-subunit alcohol dehydrogenase family)
MDLKGKAVLVTGASSGIGAELARALSNKGARVSLVARRKELLDQVARALPAGRDGALTCAADVGSREQLGQAIEQTVQRFGALDVMINNAATGWFGPTATMPEHEFDRLVRTNVQGLFHAVQLAVPHLKASRGMIVNISSGLSKRALPFLTAYAASKSFMDALSDGLRLELRPYGIRVLTYGPPETDTEMMSAGPRDPAMDLGAMRRRKLHRPRDVAARILRAIEAERREVVEGSFLKVANFFAPRALDAMFYKGMVQKLMKP